MVQMKESIPQDDSKNNVCVYISREDERIDWTKSAKRDTIIFAVISPWPVAYTTMNDKNLKLYQAHIEKGKTENQVKL